MFGPTLSPDLTLALTLAHVAISLLAIASGLVILADLLRGRYSATWTAVFLATTIATSASGFLFASASFGPPHVVGLLSLVLLALALWALGIGRRAGVWRPVYTVCAVAALYLNVFVGVVQAFQKIGVLHALAPNGSEPAFLVAQLLTLAIFVTLGFLAVRQPSASGWHASR